MKHHIRRLTAEDCPHLEDLRRAYSAEMSDSEDGTNCSGFAPALLSHPNVLCWGAFMNAELVAFAVVFHLPEAISGRWCGLLDDLYVAPEARRRGLARNLLETIFRHGQQENWTHLRWLVPETDAPAIALYERVADEAPWRSFMIYY